MSRKTRRVDPGSQWPLIGPGVYCEDYLDQGGHSLNVTVGHDHRMIKRVRCKANDGDLIGPGVYCEQYLDEGGYHQIVAVGEDHRILDRVRILRVGEEARYANYLRQKHGLYDLLKNERRCRVCRM